MCLMLISGVLIYFVVGPIFSAPYKPSKPEEVLSMLEVSNLKRTDKIVDLGSGDGRLVLAASRVCEKAVGIEINPFLNVFARVIEILSANGDVEFKNKSYWQENLGEYDVVFMYLLPSDIAKLKIKLEKELEKGARVVTHSFRVKGWEPTDMIELKGHKFYRYEIGKSNK